MFLFEWQQIYIILFILYLIPGLLLTLIKIGNLNFLERWFLGIILSYLSITNLTIIISYILGNISLISIALSYIAFLIIMLILIKNRIDYKFNIDKEHIYAILLLLLIISSWNLRIFSFSPIYYEFDPYFYLDGVKYLLNYGQIPKYDDSAWNPYNVSTHRNPPFYHYNIGSLYYLMYGNVIDDIRLAAVANLFPPINAILMIFSFYLVALIITNNRLLSIAFAYFVSMIPIFILKFQAGVFEYQPFNFFIFSILIASLALALKTKDNIAYVLLTLSYISAITGAVALPAIIIIFLISLGLAYIKYEKDVQDILMYLSIASIAGIFLFIYSESLSRLLFGLSPAALYISSKLRKDININQNIVLLAILLFFVLSIILFKDTILYAMQYNNPLERTIAEQNPAGATLEDNFGKLGIAPDRLGKDPYSTILKLLISIFFYIPSAILNAMFSIIFKILSSFMVIEWIDKETSIAYGILFFALLFYLSDIYKFVKNRIEFNDAFIISVPMLLFTIGLLKAKFEIYFTFGYLFILLYFISKILSLHKSIPIVLSVLLFIFTGYSGVSTIDTMSLLLRSNFVTPISQNIELLNETLKTFCNQYPSFNNICENITITTQYSRIACQLDLILNRRSDIIYNILYSTSCNHIPIEWYSPMMFIRDQTEPDAIITSWWDYGHWINYWGNRRATIRNDHSVLSMILDVAYSYIIGNESQLRETLDKYGSKYALFDREIILGGDVIFGGKFYALNYLACAKIKQVNESFPMFSSRCEADNTWEIVILSDERCFINNKIGRVGYRLEYKGYTGALSPERIRSYCVVNNDGVLDLNRIENRFVLELINNYPIRHVLYDINTLRLHKGIPILINQNALLILYTEDRAWFDDGNWVDGYKDATKRFYNSTIYRAYVLEKLDGFDLVFNNGYVKIYKVK